MEALNTLNHRIRVCYKKKTFAYLQDIFELSIFRSLPHDLQKPSVVPSVHT